MGRVGAGVAGKGRGRGVAGLAPSFDHWSNDHSFDHWSNDLSFGQGNRSGQTGVKGLQTSSPI
jgi:hypothetical protein